MSLDKTPTLGMLVGEASAFGAVSITAAAPILLAAPGPLTKSSRIYVQPTNGDVYYASTSVGLTISTGMLLESKAVIQLESGDWYAISGGVVDVRIREVLD